MLSGLCFINDVWGTVVTMTNTAINGSWQGVNITCSSAWTYGDTGETCGIITLYQPKCLLPKCKLEVGPVSFWFGYKRCMGYLGSGFSAGCLIAPIVLTNVPTGGQDTHSPVADSCSLGSKAAWPGMPPNTLAFQQPDKQVCFAAWALSALDPFPLFPFVKLSPDPNSPNSCILVFW